MKVLRRISGMATLDDSWDSCNMFLLSWQLLLSCQRPLYVWLTVSNTVTHEALTTSCTKKIKTKLFRLSRFIYNRSLDLLGRGDLHHKLPKTLSSLQQRTKKSMKSGTLTEEEVQFTSVKLSLKAESLKFKEKTLIFFHCQVLWHIKPRLQ